MTTGDKDESNIVFVRKS